jgi:hypothetical protein
VFVLNVKFYVAQITPAVGLKGARQNLCTQYLMVGCAVLAGLAITFQKSFICINFLSNFLKHMANVARRYFPRKFIGFALAMCAGKAWQKWQVSHQNQHPKLDPIQLCT